VLRLLLLLRHPVVLRHQPYKYSHAALRNL
jgi:hypothetical protein